MITGFVVLKVPEIDFLDSLFIDNDFISIIRDVIALIGGTWFFWRSIVMLNKRIKEREVDIKLKEQELLEKKQGVKEAIDELTKLLK